jgi:hypothetical protein
MGFTPTDQEILSPVFGDCLSACVATILDLPLSAVPVFARPGQNWGQMVDLLNAWLAPRGLVAVLSLSPPAGLGIAKGPSPRFVGGGHCVVVRDGVLVWDPHPSRAGLAAGETSYLAILRRTP